jgi:hypothetical protein
MKTCEGKDHREELLFNDGVVAFCRRKTASSVRDGPIVLEKYGPEAG